MDFIELLKTVIIGIVEGITEWLPISSTGHMILVDEFLKLNCSTEFKEMFLVVIHLGAILAVVVLYWNKLWPFRSNKEGTVAQKMTLWSKILVGCVPAGIIGVLFNDKIDEIFYNYQTVTITLIVYGILFIVIENKNKNKKPEVTSLAEMSYKTAFWVGGFQLLALIPGTSRSGATILGAIMIGMSRTSAAEFSFFLSVPVMLGASGLKLLKFGFNFTGQEALILVVGMVVAFVVSILAIKFLLGYIKGHDFKAFGWYRIVLGLLVAGYFMFLG